MNNPRYNVVYETNWDRRLRFSNQLHSYRDTGVLLGYWFDERARAEAETDELLDKYVKNELPFQKLDSYLSSLSIPIQLTANLDGYLHHGDIIKIKWCGEEGRNFFLSALPQRIGMDGTFSEPCLAVGTEDTRTLIRTAFHVFRNNNNTPNYIPLTYGEKIQICTSESSGHRFLHCEPKAFNSFAKQSKHLEVTWDKELSMRSLWRVLAEDKKARRRAEGHFIPVNTTVILSHLATAQFLAIEMDTSIETNFGTEKEISGHTYVDAQKVEGPENKWQFEAPLIKASDYGEPIIIPPLKE